jgi:hypothetical protein
MMTVNDIETRVTTLEEYVAQTIRKGEAHRIQQLEQNVLHLQKDLFQCREQIDSLQVAIVWLTGRGLNAPAFPVVDL